MRLSSDIVAFSPLKDLKDGLDEMAPLNSKFERRLNSNSLKFALCYEFEFRFHCTIKRDAIPGGLK